MKIEIRRNTEEKMVIQILRSGFKISDHVREPRRVAEFRV
jgi:molecular chaperone GrpE (heat shock protein)